jgi:hypothetical protein
MKPLLVKFHLTKKVFVCAKNEEKKIGHLKFYPIFCCLMWCFSIGETLLWHILCSVMSKVYKHAKNESKSFVKTLRKLILKIIVPFKRPSHGWKNWAKGSKNKKLHELKLVCCHKNLKLLHKPSLPQKLYFCQETLCRKC